MVGNKHVMGDPVEMNTHWVLPIPPSLNRLYHNWRGRMVKSKEGKDYAKKLAEIMTGTIPTDREVSLFIEFFRPRKAGDIDNYLKCFLDSLTGIVYKDDKQIVELHVYRFDDKERPRVELTAYVKVQRP